MTQYIDKERVVSLIEERRDAAISRQKNLEKIGDESVLNEMIAFNLDKILEAINTLEVKEVDLEKEIDKWWCSLYTDYSMKRVPNHKFVPEPSYMDSNFKQSETGKTKIAFALYIDWKVDSNDIEWDADTVRDFAKHFFELGLKAKGE